MTTTQSIAVIPLDRAARYGKQLTSHLSRRTNGVWSIDSSTGWIEIEGSRATIAADGTQLTMRLEADEQRLDYLENVLSRHLQRFVASSALTITWLRTSARP